MSIKEEKKINSCIRVSELMSIKEERRRLIRVSELMSIKEERRRLIRVSELMLIKEEKKINSCIRTNVD